ncbi:MAG: pyrophosphokinae, partial [Nocardioidaceae bacterium]|nr:pyrophosphokinae [Nocardioidaceae bacterium]
MAQEPLPETRRETTETPEGSEAPAVVVERVPQAPTRRTRPARPQGAPTEEPAVTGRSVRSRLARLGTRPQTATNPVLEPLFRAVRANHPKADLALIERAYDTADRLHAGVMRRSGDPYITHPLAVTTILADIGMTEPTLVAALLHDTVEDTSYTLDQLRTDFGDEVALLVDGVTKLD